MTKLLGIDKELIRIICPGISDSQLDIEYDIFNGITISQKAKNGYPIKEEEIDELIEKQSLIKILQAMDGNISLNDYNVSENVIKYLEEQSTLLKKIKIKKVAVCNHTNVTSNINMPSIFLVINRKILRKICVYIARHPNDIESKKIMNYLENEKSKVK